LTADAASPFDPFPHDLAVVLDGVEHVVYQFEQLGCRGKAVVFVLNDATIQNYALVIAILLFGLMEYLQCPER
jgi:hypothetical protein